MGGRTPTTPRVLAGIGLALATALTVAFFAHPGSGSAVVRALELIAVIVLGLVALTAVAALVTSWLGGWQQDEDEFELTVRRAEELAARGTVGDPDEAEFLELD